MVDRVSTQVGHLVDLELVDRVNTQVGQLVDLELVDKDNTLEDLDQELEDRVNIQEDLELVDKDNIQEDLDFIPAAGLITTPTLSTLTTPTPWAGMAGLHLTRLGLANSTREDE